MTTVTYICDFDNVNINIKCNICVIISITFIKLCLIPQVTVNKVFIISFTNVKKIIIKKITSLP